MSTLLYRGRGLQRHPQRLYPALWVAAAGVTLFSLIGIVSMTGYWPKQPGRSEVTAVSAPALPRPVISDSSCKQCGVIESVSGLERNNSGIGALIGAFSGAVLGSSIGQGNSGEAMTLIGSVTGAQAGSEIEHRGTRPDTWQVRLRMEDGSLQVINTHIPPELPIGTRVRLVDEQLIAVPGK
ncbi:MAG TPA: glycine zipper 2TM domain-containing protein [Rhodocyclaceae bacterium]|nr:glycine zipper 2TM domain-containing protein [Rhodocyclaceae bacterium]